MSTQTEQPVAMTIEELSKLSNRQLDALCGPIVGWKFHPPYEGSDAKPHEAIHCWLPPSETVRCQLLPEWSEDLNAMHEARATMTEDECKDFNHALMDAKPPRKEIKVPAVRWTWGSTAREQCIAFIYTKSNS